VLRRGWTFRVGIAYDVPTQFGSVTEPFHFEVHMRISTSQCDSDMRHSYLNETFIKLYLQQQRVIWNLAKKILISIWMRF